MNPFLIFVIALAALVLAIGVLVASRFKVAGPNEAFIVTGRKGRAVTNPETGSISTDLSGQKVVMGASTFVLPVVQKLAVLDLSSRQIGISVGSAVSAQGIRCSLEGVAIVKVGGTEDAVRAAAQRFLGQQVEIEPFTQEVLAGSLRAIVGRLSIEEIVKDRAAFAREVAEEAEASLTNQGLVLDTFQLQDIKTEGTYLTDLGRPEAARAEKEAAIAEAVARREAEQARIKAEEEIAIANRELNLRKASIQAETDAAAAKALAAGPLAEGGEGPGGHRRPGAGGRADGGAQGARARHRGAQAGRRRAVRRRAGRRGREDQAGARGRGRPHRRHRERPGPRRGGSSRRCRRAPATRGAGEGDRAGGPRPGCRRARPPRGRRRGAQARRRRRSRVDPRSRRRRGDGDGEEGRPRTSSTARPRSSTCWPTCCRSSSRRPQHRSPTSTR